LQTEERIIIKCREYADGDWVPSFYLFRSTVK